jgi:hypothetical protein
MNLPRELTKKLSDIDNAPGLRTVGQKAVAILRAFFDFSEMSQSEFWPTRNEKRRALRTCARLARVSTNEIDLCAALMTKGPPEYIEAVRSGLYSSSGSAYAMWKRDASQNRKRCAVGLPPLTPTLKPVGRPPVAGKRMEVDHTQEEMEAEAVGPAGDNEGPPLELRAATYKHLFDAARKAQVNPTESLQNVLSVVSGALDMIEIEVKKSDDRELATLVTETRDRISMLKMQASHLLVRRSKGRKKA